MLEIVTAALPYANGALHCGHFFEATLADVCVRYRRMRGRRVVFVCGQDAHGTAITLSAMSLGISEEAQIARMAERHKQTYALGHVVFDCFSSTHVPDNRVITEAMYRAMQQDGGVREVSVTLPYDPVDQIFLADRFVRGTCPHCQAPEQSGDHCDRCGSTYDASELINPVSRRSGAPLEWRDSSHVMVTLERYRTMLISFLSALDCVESVKHKLMEWFQGPLRDWDITRDGPYFGFPIPDRRDQYFYVWMDAPCGYLAALKEALALPSWETVCASWNEAHITHVIGKDVVYFHGLFWPAMLHAAQLKTPDTLLCHGFVTVAGEKMSKSKGNYIDVDALIMKVGADALRYYMASKFTPGLSDIDLSLDDFIDKVHADLIGKSINLGARVAGFVTRLGSGVLSGDQDEVWLGALQSYEHLVVEAYESWHYAEALRLVMRLCDEANRWVDHHKPWALAKVDPEAAWRIASTALQVYRWVWLALSPVCPDLGKRALDLFGDAERTLVFNRLPPGHRIEVFEPLMTRYDRASLLSVFGLDA